MRSEQSELDELYRVLGQKLAGIRQEAGLTQAQLAARLRGTNRGWQPAVSRFEQGKAMAKLDTWVAEHDLPPQPFSRMKQAIITLFADMERMGELD